MSTLDDLLSQRRRAPLSDADERRVQIGVKSSRDHQLALLAGEVFERDGAPQPGDGELVRKIVRQVEGEWSGTFQRQAPGRPKWSRWAAVPTLVAGVAAASWGGLRGLQGLRGDEAPPAPPASVSPAAAEVAPLSPAAEQVRTLPPPLGAAANEPEELEVAPAVAPPAAVRPPEVLPPEVLPPEVSHPEAVRSAVARPEAARARRAPSRTAAVARSAAPSRAAPSRAAPSSAPVLLRPAAPPSSAGTAAGLPPELTLQPDDTARSLFLRANKLRRDDWAAAASLYELLTQRFARSTEAGVAEMALGKHALDEGLPQQALRWFRAYQQRPSGELTSEALWGEARALESLGEAAAARAVWRRLLTEYPASAYAAVARQQLGN